MLNIYFWKIYIFILWRLRISLLELSNKQTKVTLLYCTYIFFFYLCRDFLKRFKNRSFLLKNQPTKISVSYIFYAWNPRTPWQMIWLLIEYDFELADLLRFWRIWYIRIVLYASLSQVMQCMHAVLCTEYSQYSWPLLKIVVCAVYVSFYFEVKNAVYTNDHKFVNLSNSWFK